MMGRLDGGTEKLFYEFSLEEAVPSDHLLLKIDRFLGHHVAKIDAYSEFHPLPLR